MSSFTKRYIWIIWNLIIPKIPEWKISFASWRVHGFKMERPRKLWRWSTEHAVFYDKAKNYTLKMFMFLLNFIQSSWPVASFALLSSTFFKFNNRDWSIKRNIEENKVILFVYSQRDCMCRTKTKATPGRWTGRGGVDWCWRLWCCASSTNNDLATVRHHHHIDRNNSGARGFAVSVHVT